MLLERYRPKTTGEIIGNSVQIGAIRAFLGNWKKGKVLFLYGPTGIGKSSAVRLVAKEMDFQVVESHADEDRKYKNRGRFISMSKQRSIISQKKLILIDEAELIDSVRMLSELIKESAVPVVLIGENPYEKKFSSVRRYFKMIKFQSPSVSEITRFLSFVCSSENMNLETRHISQISRMCNGDIRAALIDLDIFKILGGIEGIGHREHMDDIFNLLKLVFRSSSIENTRALLSRCDDPDKLITWISENIMNEFRDPEDRASAYDYLSKADLFRSRIIKRQAWSLQKYYFNLSAMGMSTNKKQVSSGFVRYMPPKFFFRRNNKAISEKISNKLHVSKARSKEYVPLLKSVIDTENRESIINNFGFDENDIEFLES